MRSGRQAGRQAGGYEKVGPVPVGGDTDERTNDRPKEPTKVSTIGTKGTTQQEHGEGRRGKPCERRRKKKK